jgi:flagellar biosynthetic protein FliR
VSPATLTLDGGQVATLFLVLLRVTGFVVAAPIFGHRSVPGMVKAGLAVTLTVALSGHATIASGAMPVLLAAPIELLVGLVLGTLLGLGLRAAEIAGRLLSLQAGLSLSSVLGPTFDEGATPLDPLFSVLGALLFLAMGLHIALVAALARSFGPFPLGGALQADIGQFGAQLSALIIDAGVQLALPLSITLLLVELAVALLSRAIPTLNVFILGLPIKLLATIVVFLAALPFFMDALGHLYTMVFRAVGTGSLP